MQFIETLIINRAPGTQKCLLSLYNRHFKNYENKDLNYLFSQWKTSGLGPRTIKKLLTIYRAWHIETTGKVPNLKYYNFNLELEETTSVKAWTKEQARKVLDYSKYDDNLYLTILLSLHTGARPGEVCNILWTDVDFNNKKVFIRSNKNHKLKTSCSRAIKLSSELEEALNKFNFGTKTIVKPISKLNDKLKRLAKLVDVPEITAHKMRHTTATIALDSGISPREVAKLLGHKQVSTTINIYWQSLKELEVDSFVP